MECGMYFPAVDYLIRFAGIYRLLWYLLCSGVAYMPTQTKVPSYPSEAYCRPIQRKSVRSRLVHGFFPILKISYYLRWLVPESLIRT